MSARTITAEVQAWLYSHYGPDDLNGDPADVVARLYMCNRKTAGDMCLVGTATITVTLIDESAMVENKVGALRAEQEKVRADATAQVTRLERKIQQLLAIDYTPEVPQ